jgi:hypothetical protein
VTVSKEKDLKAIWCLCSWLFEQSISRRAHRSSLAKSRHYHERASAKNIIINQPMRTRGCFQHQLLIWRGAKCVLIQEDERQELLPASKGAKTFVLALAARRPEVTHQRIMKGLCGIIQRRRCSRAPRGSKSKSKMHFSAGRRSGSALNHET